MPLQKSNHPRIPIQIKQQRLKLSYLNFISFNRLKGVIPISSNAFINRQEEEIQPIIVSTIQLG